MITVTKSDLKRFFDNASGIKNTSTIPVCDYVKLECRKNKSTITKTNLKAFCITDVEPEFDEEQTLLIEESALKAAMTYCKSNSLKISKNGKGLILDDGVRPIKSQTQESNLFPVIENVDFGDAAELDTDVLGAMKIAKGHAMAADDTMLHWMQYVSSKTINGVSYVFGTNSSVGYFQTFKTKLPEFCVDPNDVIPVITKYPYVNFFSSDSYNYFRCVSVVYGFSKSEVKIPDIAPVLARLKSNESFQIKRDDLVNFCELAISLNTTAVPPSITLDDCGDDKIVLEFHDVADNNSTREEISVEEKNYTVTKFTFQPKLLLTALKDLSSEKIRLSRIEAHKNTIITADDEEGYLGFMMDIVYKTNE